MAINRLSALDRRTRSVQRKAHAQMVRKNKRTFEAVEGEMVPSVPFYRTEILPTYKSNLG